MGIIRKQVLPTVEVRERTVAERAELVVNHLIKNAKVLESGEVAIVAEESSEAKIEGMLAEGMTEVNVTAALKLRSSVESFQFQESPPGTVSVLLHFTNLNKPDPESD